MSHNQPPPEPGYGQGYGYGYGNNAQPPQQPPQPNPYAQPQQPAYGQSPQPVYGQPQQAPYGQPQAPYGQPPQPYGQPPAPGYGYPPPPPAPEQGGKRGRGRTIGIVVGVVVAIAVIGGGVFALTGGGGSGSSSDGGKKYKLTTPATVAETFKRSGSGEDSGDLSAEDEKDLRQLPGVTDPHVVSADYEGGSKAAIQFGGVYGTIAQPERAVDALFLVMAASVKKEDDKAEVVGTPAKVTPEGLDGAAVMKCQIFKTTVGSGSSSTELNIPICIWGDSSTVAMVMDLDPVAAVSGSTSTDGAAKLTAKVRNDTRVEIA